MENEEIWIKSEPIFSSCDENLSFSTDSLEQVFKIEQFDDEFVVKESKVKYGSSKVKSRSSIKNINSDEINLDIDYKGSDETVNVEILFPDHESYEPLKDDTTKVYEPIQIQESCPIPSITSEKLKKLNKNEDRSSSVVHEFDPQNPHECKLCGIRFAALRVLHHHMRTTHKNRSLKNIAKVQNLPKKGEKTNVLPWDIHKCVHCGVPFAYASTLTRHLKQIHNDKSTKKDFVELMDVVDNADGVGLQLGNLAASPHLQHDLAASPLLQRDLAASPYLQRDLAASPLLQRDLAASPYLQRDLPAIPHLQREKKEEKVKIKGVRSSTRYKCEYCEYSRSKRRYINKHIEDRHKLVNCEKCDKVFVGLILLKGHEKDVHFSFFKCEECGRKFSRLIYLEKHSCRSNIVCHICNKKLSNGHSLRLHLNLHTGEKPYGCKHCEERFATLGRLKTHIQKHPGEKRYECKICNETFSSSITRNSHTNKHFGNRFNCELCEFKTYSKILLRRHIRNVHSHSRFKCSFCNRLFSNCGNLARHKRIHTGEKPYQCKYCEKKFIQSNSLKAHMRVHQKINGDDLQCSFCDAKFTSAPDLKNHEINNHFEEVFQRRPTGWRRRGRPTKYQCIYCQKYYSTMYCLKMHLLLHTKEQKFECTTCKKKFLTLSSLKTHEKSHSDKKEFECMLCEYETCYSHNLRTHISAVHKQIKLYKCERCEKEFSTSVHLARHHMLHTGKKPFQCDLCESKFVQKIHLRYHMRTHTGEKPFKCDCGKKYSDKRCFTRHQLSCN